MHTENSSSDTQACHIGCDNCGADICTESSHIHCGRERAVLADGLELCGDCGRPTARIEVVRKPARVPSRARKSARALAAGIALGLFAGLVGCNAAVPPPAVETVGRLAAGPSIYSAPVHATTDLTPGFGAVDTGDEAPQEPTSLDVLSQEVAGGGAAVEAGAKTDGLTMGSVQR